MAFSSSPRASLVYFSDRASFDAAVPGLTIETFEAALLQTDVPSPLDSTSDNAAIDPGQIVPGVQFSSTEPVNRMLGFATFGASSKTLLKEGESVAGSALEVRFTGDNVFAAGMDIYLAVNAVTLAPATTTLSIFGDGDCSARM